MIDLSEAIRLRLLYYGSDKYKSFQGSQERDVAGGELSRRNYVKRLRAVDYIDKYMLWVIGVVKSQSGSGYYFPEIEFYDVLMDEEYSRETPLRLKNTEKEYFWCQVVDLDTYVSVRCDCADFKYRFAHELDKVSGLIGKPEPFKVKGTGKPQNIGKVRTMCKHLFALVEMLITIGLISESGKVSGVRRDLSRYFS